MDSVQFGHWISERRLKYGFRSQRTLAERVSGDPMLDKLGITENFLARLEAGSFAYPFRGHVRARVAALAWLLCATPRDVNNYYQAAGLNELDDYEAEHQRALHKHLSKQQNGQRVLPLPPRPRHLPGREAVVKEIIGSLSLMETGLYAITGLPGVGKSALASEVVHRLAADGQAQSRTFSDGIAAFTCTGRQGRSGLLTLMADVIAFFGPPALSHTASRFTREQRLPELPATESEFASILDRARLVLADKHALILLDDVEAQFPLRQVEEVLLAQDHQGLPYQKGNHMSYGQRVILTTGRFIPPPALVTHHLHLGPLEPDAALALFTALLKRSLSPEEVEAAQRVCASVGYLPLAIEVAATAVSVEGIPLPFLAAYVAGHPLDNVLDGGNVLRSRLAQALSVFDTRMQKRFAFLSTLGVPTFHLESAAATLPDEVDARRDSSGETAGSVPVEPISELIQGTDEADLPLERLADTIAVLGQFVQHSLIELTRADQSGATHNAEGKFADQGMRYHLHPLVYAHALNILNQNNQEEVQAARRNIQAYALEYIERWKGETLRIEREYDFLVAALKRAVQNAQYGPVVQLVEGLLPLATYRHNYEEGERLILYGIEASKHLADHLHQVIFLNGLGLLFRRHEKYALATQAWTESLEIASSSPNAAVWWPLAELAHLAHIRGEVDAALRYIETYLQRCLKGDNLLETAYAFSMHAFYIRLQGNLKRAYQSASEAQSLFSHSHLMAVSPHQRLIGLRVQAEMARAEGNYIASQASVEQIVSLIQSMGNDYLLVDALFDQACFAHEQGKHDDAHSLARRTIKIAESRKLWRFSERSAHLLQQLADTRDKLR